MRKLLNIISGAAMVLLFSLPSKVVGQGPVLLPHISAIPQSISYRPSLFPEHKRFFGVPFLSNMNVQWSNSSFDYTSAHTLTDTGAFLDLDVLIRDVKAKNTLGAETDIELLSFGFGGQKNFFSFNLSHRSMSLFRYTDDFINLLYEGNGMFIGQSVDLSANTFQAMQCMEIGVGYNRKLNNKWSVGIRLKRLYGMDNVSTDFSKLSVSTAVDDYTLQLNADAAVNSSSPLLDGNTDEVTGSLGAITRYMFNGKNGGWALNGGVAFLPNDRWTVTLDALDFGSITWRDAPVNYRMRQGTYSFQGIGLEQLINDDADSDDYLDSLENTFNIEETNDKFTTSLHGKLMLTGQYRIAEGTYGIVALRGMMVSEELIPSYVIMLRKDLGRRFAIAANYARQYNSINTFGAGIYLRLGSFNFFVLSDNLPGTIFPLDSRVSQVSFGLSFSQLRAIKKVKAKKQEVPEKNDVIERY